MAVLSGALLSGEAAQTTAKCAQTSGEAVRKIKTACPDSWPFQLALSSTHFKILLKTCLVSVFPCSQSEIKCWQAKHDSKARDIMYIVRLVTIGVCLNKFRVFFYIAISRVGDYTVFQTWLSNSYFCRIKSYIYLEVMKRVCFIHIE